MKLPLISVIIPVYNVDKYLSKCLDSVLKQTYPNIEIIIVNDGSTDKSEQIILEYEKNNKNITYLKHEQNKGLFQARITGMEACHGDYVAFLDSDDSVTLDFYRKMLRTAQEKDADICLAEFVWEYSDGSKMYIPTQELRNVDIEYNNEEILDKFIGGHAYDFLWQVVWNKLIKRTVIEKTLPYVKEFSQKCGPLIMAEDVAYSITFYLFANKVVNCHNVYYNYFQHAGQSVNSNSKEKFKRNLKDVVKVFDYFKYILDANGKLIKYEDDFLKFRGNLYACYYTIAENMGILKEFYQIIGEKQGIREYKNISISNYEQRIDFHSKFNEYENIVKEIISEDIEVVSFDIFDTLLLRNTYCPTDVFVLMSVEMQDRLSTAFFCKFDQIRQTAEHYARQKHINPEIDIDDIYNYMIENYGLDPKLANDLKEKEMEIEYEVSTKRVTGFDLYDIATINQKKIVYVSDMYLTEEFIYSLLNKNGYDINNKLYLSNVYKENKYGGGLYKKVIKDCHVKGKDIVHIGDNYFSDVEQAKKSGIKSFWLPNVNHLFYENLFTKMDYFDVKPIDIRNNQYIGLRQMFATVQNKLFDFPFVNSFSNLQLSTKYLGFYAVGMELFAFVDWITENVREKNCVHFVARDGYIPQKAYEIFRQYDKKLPKSNYFYMSRKFLYPLSINTKNDFYTSFNQMNLLNFNITKILGYFPEKCVNKEKLEELSKSKKCKNFTDLDDFCKNIDIIYDCIDFKEFSKYKEKVKKYLAKIVKQKDILIDIGYSGRGEAIISSLLNFSIESLYIHGNGDLLYQNANKSGCKNKSFFNYKPKVTGELREMLFMKRDPSFIGYSFDEDGKISMMFDNKNANNEHEHAILNAIQVNAVQFIELLFNNNKNFMECLRMYPKEVATIPLENFLHNPDYLDKMMLGKFGFEDDIGLGEINVISNWDSQNYQGYRSNGNNSIKSVPKRKLLRKIGRILLPKGSKRRGFAIRCADKLFPRGSKRREYLKSKLL